MSASGVPNKNRASPNRYPIDLLNYFTKARIRIREALCGNPHIVLRSPADFHTTIALTRPRRPPIPAPDFASPRSSPAWSWLAPRRVAAVLMALALLAALDTLARHAAARWAYGNVRVAAETAAQLRVAVLQSEIDKHRALPFILAEDPDVRAAVQDKGPGQIEALNHKFETLSAGARVSVIYLLDAGGLTIAASNWRTPTSFVGVNYHFRPYYRLAMERGTAAHFAFGTISRVPGLYLARRIDGPSGPTGVIVVKVEFNEIEAEWRRFDTPTFVTDERTIVLVTSEPAWRFRALTAIPPHMRDDIRASLQFGDASLDALPFADGAPRTEPDVVSLRLPGSTEARSFVEQAASVPGTGWTLHVLAPAEPTAGLAEAAARAVALMAGLFSIGAMALWLRRRRRLAEERAGQDQVRRELETRVGERTAELEAVNRRLVAEIEDKERAEAALDNLQDELVQASKLAVLGQISASVAHEINQPVAAIRAYADNARQFLSRTQPDAADANLATIAALTEKIGTITSELRAFARKAPAHVEAVSIDQVIDGAMLLIGHRLRLQAVDLTLDVAEPGLRATVDRVRLEQVLVNLLQNALQALAGQPDGRIRIAAAARGGEIVITIADNGPGLPAEVMRELFMPFRTTKPDGLGLGLVISNDIVREAGGSFRAENQDGAVFIITLPKAPRPTSRSSTTTRCCGPPMCRR
jgi:two-component system, NtrC family, C4-dicarboxylate transport sensor histidine kinase DctB